MKVNENLTLAERMKAAIVAKIVRAGLVQEGEAQRITLSDVPYFMEWATGFGGIWLVGETEAGEEFFYTIDAWNALEDATREARLKRAAGILFRARGQEFTIAMQDCLDTYAWCPEVPEDADQIVVNIPIRNGTQFAATDFNGLSNTAALLAVESPAAIAAVKYKETGIHGAELADWYLPGYGHWSLIFAYRNKINVALKAFFGVNNYLTQASFWTSTPADSLRAWVLPNPSTTAYTTGGSNPYRTAQYKVRACSQYKCNKRFMIYGKD